MSKIACMASEPTQSTDLAGHTVAVLGMCDVVTRMQEEKDKVAFASPQDANGCAMQ